MLKDSWDIWVWNFQHKSWRHFFSQVNLNLVRNSDNRFPGTRDGSNVITSSQSFSSDVIVLCFSISTMFCPERRCAIFTTDILFLYIIFFFFFDQTDFKQIKFSLRKVWKLPEIFSPSRVPARSITLIRHEYLFETSRRPVNYQNTEIQWDLDQQWIRTQSNILLGWLMVYRTRCAGLFVQKTKWYSL